MRTYRVVILTLLGLLILGSAVGAESFVIRSSAIQYSSDGVIGKIHTNINPTDGAFDPWNGNMYVSTLAGDIDVVNSSTFAITNRIDTLGPEYNDVFANNTKLLYVSVQTANVLEVINVTTRKIVASAPVGDQPEGLVWDPANNYIYVANTLSNSVTVINDLSNAVVQNVPVGSLPRGVAYDPSDNYVYVVNAGSNTVSVVNGLQVVASITVGDNPRFAAYNPTNHDVYISEYDGIVYVIKGISVIATINVGEGVQDGISYDPKNHEIYLSDYYSDLVTKIKGLLVVQEIHVGSGPARITYDPVNNAMYVDMYEGKAVWVLR